MDTLLVRLKTHDPRRGHLLRRFTYAGVKFHEERGWYRVAKAVAEYLRSVRQVNDAEHSPVAFDVCNEEEALALDAKEQADTKVRRAAVDEIAVSVARSEAPVVAADGSEVPRLPAPEPKARKEK